MAQAFPRDETGGGPATLRTPADAIALFRPLLSERAVEHVAAAYLDDDFGVIRVDLIAEGDASAAALPIRTMLAAALHAGAARLILAHNHPAGDPAPSDRDRDATRRLGDAAKALDIDFVDHIVVARGGSYSFRLDGLM